MGSHTSVPLNDLHLRGTDREKAWESSPPWPPQTPGLTKNHRPSPLALNLPLSEMIGCGWWCCRPRVFVCRLWDDISYIISLLSKDIYRQRVVVRGASTGSTMLTRPPGALRRFGGSFGVPSSSLRTHPQNGFGRGETSTVQKRSKNLRSHVTYPAETFVARGCFDREC